MKKTTLLLLLFIAGLTASSQYNQTKMVITPTEHDFGVFKEEAGRQTFDFIVKNTGSQPLVIQRVTASCRCTAIQQGNQGIGIKPGESGSIKATFNSGGYKGKVTKTIYVYTNDPKSSEVILTLTAYVE